ncbi:MAG: hypothetical protein KDB54_00260 [Solirubrobacterales bacterium]|nr:hypothetical protein [Solirubrobacterales bacterium]MCB0859070.1 hypothetical protein [Solirubrobacterales bacterium]
MNRPVTFANHAIERYRERLRPALSIEGAALELKRLSAHSTIDPDGPSWMSPERKDDRTSFLEIGDAAFPLEPSDDGETLVAKTCLVRGSLSPQARDRRNRMRRSRRRPG